METQHETSLHSSAPAFEQSLVESLNLEKWQPGHNYAEFYQKVEDEVRISTQNEDVAVRAIRSELIPEKIVSRLSADISAVAFQQFNVGQIEKAHLGLLFNGCTEASDGTIVMHDTLPLTITQIGVCLVSYQGEQGAYAHRIFRRDLQMQGDDILEEIKQLLTERQNRGTTGQADENTSAGRSMLAQRGLMAYAERAILMEKSSALWRMGHGNPIPYELLTGYWATREEMARAAISLFQKMIAHERFVFVLSNTSRRELITIGGALKPLEYLIVDTAKGDLVSLIERGGARGKMREIQRAFAEQHGDDIVLGLFRASAISPAYLFYAHRKHLEIAALLAISDALLQEHRGFPMLIDIADNICTATFGAETFYATIRSAYADANQPYRYLNERETRK
jgi:hypothetical protein